MLYERLEFIAAIKEGKAAREKLVEEVTALLCGYIEREFGYRVPTRGPYASAVNSLVQDIVRSLTGSDL